MAREAALRRRPVRALYAALGILFVIATGYQVRALKQIFPQWFGAEFVQWPFLLEAEDQPLFSWNLFARMRAMQVCAMETR